MKVEQTLAQLQSRGKIRDRQQRDLTMNFENLRFNNITPTDVDGFVEKGDKCFVFFEMKYKDADLLPGQKLAFTRLIDSLDKPAVFIVASHEIDVATSSEEVDAGNAIVKRLYYQKAWQEITHGQTLREVVERFFDKHA